MHEKIIQTNNTPFKLIDVDPITLDIIESALRNTREQMDATLFRTAMSPGIREQGDAFPMIANADGKMVVGQFGSFIHGFMEGFEGTLEEGDMIFTNDPYSCGGAISHLNDYLVIKPIFKDGRHMAWAAHFGHLTDVGGRVPGSLPNEAREIFEEGVAFPPVKIFRKGELQEDLIKIAIRNSRMPNWNQADFKGIIAACTVAERRCIEMAERFGDDEFYSALDALLERNCRAMRQLIMDTIPEEKQSFEDYICDDALGSGPYKIKCSMWREGEVVIFDFDGTDPQSPGSINFLLNEEMFKMFCGTFMISAFDPQILFNDGFYDYVDVRIPEGSLLKPIRPGALSCRTHALGRIFDVLSGLLGQGNPDFLCGAGFSDSPHFMYSGYDKNGEWYQLYQIGFGGIPARPVGDGPDGHSLWPAFKNVPNEFLEAYFPLRIETFECIIDSGGAGYHRGGNGIRMGYHFLEDGEISVHDDRWLTYPWGVNGAMPGQRSTKELVRADGSVEFLPSKCDLFQVNSGDTLFFNTWGGGGVGDPLTRETDRVLQDVQYGLVSPEAARDSYGVVLDGDTVDEVATAALRKDKTVEHTDDGKIFNFGGSIETLRANCFAETGLPAPVAPDFSKRRRAAR
ncbi:MAG: hydantoinase B/oxoprolinase family protein [Cellvibrionales bacterium]|nr:hydantoinase B/oxoprolinase family protein [Porticoccaceae bacterium]|tara:strand:+ start:17233 stop:19113 length:1881 start_codon:yes stop_codon:yes gene_type:complete